ncbi:ribokinase [Glycomyces albidus]|uniref:Ribokinase n=1 Tax=Glycomyces albidus TaxID=2656774 RepID=A0A6L5G3G1_9ACTN|nr:ribokinase [Glycomyces albidus]MQM24111.1 ribokinase [Glycomyces albidus]
MSVVVLGSANLDLVYDVERIPAPGETVLARGYGAFAGGKGNNQAVAAARAGSETRFIAALGRDENGDRLAEEARAAGIALLDRRVDAPTGTASIYVDRGGENSIVVNSGANAELTALTATELAAIGDADVLVLQLETPPGAVAEAARAARAAATAVVLNAAPADRRAEDLLGDVDVLVVNEHEANGLLGRDPGADLDAAVDALTAYGCTVVVTLGAAGCLVAAPGGEPVKVPAVPVPVVDTTGAGDTFVGYLAAAIDADERHATGAAALAGAAAFATAAAAIAVQRKGAVPSIPTLEEVRGSRDAH